jgi:cytidyltransferase-like protein
MKTNTTSSSASNNEITLGWTSMPAYGEVMTTLIGTSHTNVKSSLKARKEGLMSSFWSTLSNQVSADRRSRPSPCALHRHWYGSNLPRMQVLRSIDALSSLPGPLALAVGVFDGLHLGHQEVIRAAQEHAAQHHGTAVVVTFDPHPAHVLRPGSAPKLLCGPRHQQLVLSQIGIPCLLACPFTTETARTPAR